MENHDPALEKAKHYQRQHQALSLIQLALSPLIMGALVLTPLSLAFKRIAEGASPNAFATAAVYFSLFSCFLLLFEIPMGFYSGFVLEKKYELSNHTVFSWLADFLKRSALSFAFSLALIVALYALIWRFPGGWWLLAWGGFALVSFGIGKLFPVLIVPLFYKYQPLAQESLRSKIVGLSDRYGMPIQNVYSLNLSRTTKKANAAFMGMGGTRRVVLSDTLLEHFTEDEIETVVAHELGHFKHGDIWKQLAFGLTTSLAAFWLANHFLGAAARSLGLDGAGDIAALPLLFLIFYFFFLVLMPAQNAFSRAIERDADRFALKAFPRPDIFISCMEKLARVNLSDPEPHPAVEWFFYDHPAIGKRIAMARAWKPR